MSVYNALAENLRQVRLDLTKCGQPAPRKDGPYWSCLQQLDGLADILEGKVRIVPPEDAQRGPHAPAPKQRVVRDGNIIEVPRDRWPGRPGVRKGRAR